MEHKVLAIVAMHRSGSSLCTQWLQSCGLHVGEDLISASYANPYGHFEDKSFVRFHQSILQKRGYNYRFRKKDSIRFTEEEKKEALKLFNEKRKLNQEWGWKDPRTCLFLKDWLQIIPNLKLLVLIREPELVVDSLLRRKFQNHRHYSGFVKIKSRVLDRLNEFFLVRKEKEAYSATYEAYYDKVIQQLTQLNHGTQYLVMSTKSLINNQKRLVQYMNNNWGFALENIPFESIYIPVNLNKSEIKYPLNPCWEEKLTSIFSTLKQYEQHSQSLLNG